MKNCDFSDWRGETLINTRWWRWLPIVRRLEERIEILKWQVNPQDIYVDSAGSNTIPFDSWEKAAKTMVDAMKLFRPGDAILVSKNHQETIEDPNVLKTNHKVLVSVYSIDPSEYKGKEE